MTTRTWNGSNGSFSSAASWSPAGVPAAGDVAVINAGTVAVAGAVSGVAFQLNEPSGGGASTTLALNGATLDSASTLVVNNQNAFNSVAPAISTSGISTIAGTGSFYGTQILMPIASGSTLINAGTLDFYATSPQVTGGGTFQNNGTFALLNPNSVAQIPVIADSVTGTGLFALGTHARIAFTGAVGSGQTVLMNDGAAGSETLEIDQPTTFNGLINGFSSSDLISVINTPFTNATYTSTGANSGVLRLFSGSTAEGSFNFSGQYTLSSFGLKFNDFGGGQSNLQITTSVVNAQSGGLPSGFQNGGNGAGPVYRFFDTKFGTHFFTADQGEKNTVIATRPDLVEETNGFGDIAQGDPNATPVFRFFDTKFGTHFFTASAGERDSVINGRPDLTYEPSSTFFEHATAQAGDVQVYRFFDTRFGTHFYTGDQNEYNGIVTPGASTFRADLTFEKVEFYAPKGSFV